MVKSRLLAEAEYFEQHRQEFCREHAGRYAVVKGSKVLGFYKTPEAAYEAGAEAYGIEPFLLRRVSRKESPLDYVFINADVIHGIH